VNSVTSDFSASGLLGSWPQHDPARDGQSDHLVALPGAEWAFWRWACLRGSGFPAHLVEQLSSAECAAAADDLLRLESEIEQRNDEAVGAIEAEIREANEKAKQKHLVKALKRLKRGEVPNYVEGTALRAIEVFAAALPELVRARANFKEVFQTSTRQIAARIRELSADPLFRQAVLLQNRKALSHVERAFASERGQHKRGFKERQNEELIANYLQRYCLKNDTVGFFGPVGWARLQSDGRGLTARPGPNLVSSSSIYFEHWGIQALADKISEDGRLLPWVPVRLLPFFRVEGNTLYVPSGAPTPIPPAYATLLAKCDGEKTAGQIARELLKIPGSEFTSEAQVYVTLQTLCAKKILSWKIELPFTLYPERKLRTLLERIEPTELGRPAVEALNELEHGRENVRRAVGDPVRLGEALEQLDNAFTRLTSLKSTRADGAMYAGRTLTYQDCMRDLEVSVGGDLLEEVSKPLSLWLTTARWFTHQVAVACGRLFENLYTELASDGRRSRVELLQFWSRLHPLLYDPETKLLDGVVKDFQRRWAEVLPAPGFQRRVAFRSEELRGKVEQLFCAPWAGWQLARYASPDVMIAASSPEAVSAADYFFVLGEVHLATNTCGGAFMVAQHPRPHELFEAIERDIPDTILSAVPPRQWPRLTNRTAGVLIPSRAYYLESSPDAIADAPRFRVIPISDMVVEDSPNGLKVSTRDGRLSFEIIEAFGELLSLIAVDVMKLLNSSPHTPRITIDRLVVMRESWAIDASVFNFVAEAEEHARYLEVRRLANQYGFPRRVFVKIPNETKPFYVDFKSPEYVGILVKMLRRARTRPQINNSVVISEMLPTPEQLWLRDAAQNTYTSELRMVARDLLLPRADQRACRRSHG
jgi:hypothetical protein